MHKLNGNLISINVELEGPLKLTLSIAVAHLCEVTKHLPTLAVVVVGGVPIKPAIDAALVLTPGQPPERNTVIVEHKRAGGGALTGNAVTKCGFVGERKVQDVHCHENTQGLGAV